MAKKNIYLRIQIFNFQFRHFLLVISYILFYRYQKLPHYLKNISM